MPIMFNSFHFQVTRYENYTCPNYLTVQDILYFQFENVHLFGY